MPTLEISAAALAQLEGLRETLGFGTAAEALEAICAHEGLMRSARDSLRNLAQLREAPDVPLLRPVRQLIPTPAVVGAAGSTLVAYLPERHEVFRTTVRKLGMRWGGRRWERHIAEQRGPMLDRVVELACVLLGAGFVVQLPSEELRARVERSEYELERTRWISALVSGPHAGWFRLEWSRDEDLYYAAKRIHGSRYSKPYVLAPASSAAEVQDFAELYGFRLTDGARALTERQREVILGMPMVEPEIREAVPAVPAKRRPTLPDDYGIDDALADGPL